MNPVNLIVLAAQEVATRDLAGLGSQHAQHLWLFALGAFVLAVMVLWRIYLRSTTKVELERVEILLQEHDEERKRQF